MQILTGLGKEPMALMFSPDGHYLSAGDDRSLHVWNLSKRASPARSWWHAHKDRWTVCFAPDSASIVRRHSQRGFERCQIQADETRGDEALSKFNPRCFSPDGRFACSSTANALRLSRAVDIKRWEELWRKDCPPTPHESGVGRLAFGSDSARLARFVQVGPDNLGTAKWEIELVECASGELVARWEGDLPWYFNNEAVSSQGAVAIRQGNAFIAFNMTDPDAQPVKRKNTSVKHFTAAAFSPDGSRLATTSNDTAATIWDTTTWEVRRRYEWQIGRLRTVCFAPDGLRCAAGSDSGQIVVWDLDE